MVKINLMKKIKNKILSTANATIREPELKFGKELGHRQHQQQGHNDHGYENVQQRILQLMEKEEKMLHKKDSNPLHWCQLGAEFSNCCKIILDTISEDIPRLFPPESNIIRIFVYFIRHASYIFLILELIYNYL